MRASPGSGASSSATSRSPTSACPPAVPASTPTASRSSAARRRGGARRASAIRSTQRLLPVASASRRDRGAGARAWPRRASAARGVPRRACSSGSTSAARSPTPSLVVAGGAGHRQGADDARATSRAASWPRSSAALERAGATPADVELFAHGMTVATNALLEGAARAPRCRDRGLHRPRRAGPPGAARPVPPVRRLAGTVRAAASGASARPSASRPSGVLRALEDARRRSPTRSPRARAGGGRGVPAARLPRPAHERALGDALRARLAATSTSRSRTRSSARSASSSARRRPRSTPRSPRCSARYLRALAGARRGRGPAGAGDHAVQRRPDRPRAAPPTTPRSTSCPGPAGGAAAAALLAHGGRRADLLCFDMGGTSLRRLRRRRTAPSRETGGPRGRRPAAGAADGRHPHRRRRRRLDRLARRRRRAARRPALAGAEPGPACYGRGGDGADRYRREPGARPRSSRRRWAASSSTPRRRARRSTACAQLGLADRPARGDRARGQRRDGAARCG